MRSIVLGGAIGALVFGISSFAASAAPPVNLTAEQERQNMMDQLGITELRPGRASDEHSPNYANYDESRANPHPDLPDPLVMKNGKKVTTARQWFDMRRPEIVEDFSREVYGFVPKDAPKVTWEQLATDNERLGFAPVVATKIVGHVDNSSYPAVEVNIKMTLVLPARAKGPVPVLIMFGRSGFPAPSQPTDEERDRINAALKAAIIKQDPSLAEVFKRAKG